MRLFDLVDHFIIFLMDQFRESLEADLSRWTENLVESVKDNNTNNIETCMKYIKKYRELIDDLTDENMDLKDFVGLVAEKFGLRES